MKEIKIWITCNGFTLMVQRKIIGLVLNHQPRNNLIKKRTTIILQPKSSRVCAESPDTHSCIYLLDCAFIYNKTTSQTPQDFRWKLFICPYGYLAFMRLSQHPLGTDYMLIKHLPHTQGSAYFHQNNTYFLYCFYMFFMLSK